MGRGVWQATGHGVTELDMTKHTHMHAGIGGYRQDYQGTIQEK